MRRNDRNRKYECVVAGNADNPNGTLRGRYERVI